MPRAAVIFAWLRVTVFYVSIFIVASVAARLVIDASYGMSLPAVLAWLVIFVAVPVHWFAFLVLLALVRIEPHIRVLRERFIVAGALASVVTIFGLVFLNNDVIPPPFTPQQTMIVTRLAILSLIIPALYFLWLYRQLIRTLIRERFRGKSK